jgi:site-specific DNA recombinase
MKVAAYIRVSTQMQVEDGYSLSAQRERLKAFAFLKDGKSFSFM